MPGPLPTSQRRRRNAPTIPSTQLPTEGRKGRPPKCPYELGPVGQAWWKWAWRLPQAVKWDDGALYVVARRAQLEDLLAALEAVDDVDFSLGDLLGEAEERELADRVVWLVRKLKALAGGAVQAMREMRELDNRLGLNPKALAELRWTFALPDEASAKEAPAPPAAARLRAV